LGGKELTVLWYTFFYDLPDVRCEEVPPLQSNRDFQIWKKSLSLDGFLRAADCQHGNHDIVFAPSRCGMKHIVHILPGRRKMKKE
jgi:hypothetical protein